MSLILRQVIGYGQGKRAAQDLETELKETKRDLALILNKWNWDGASPTNAQEFLNKFTPWVNEKIKLGKEVKELLERKGVNNLSEL